MAPPVSNHLARLYDDSHQAHVKTGRRQSTFRIIAAANKRKQGSLLSLCSSQVSIKVPPELATCVRQAPIV
jgi:hypothetical protein